MKLLILLILSSILNASTILGTWIFDTQASIKAKKEYAPIYNRLQGMQIKFNKNGTYKIKNKGGGYWQKRGNIFILKAKNGKKMVAKINQNGLLKIIQPTSKGYVKMLFKKASKKSKGINNYIYLNRVYKQKDKIYDNGYLYYLFQDNGTFYSYASNKEQVTPKEIKTKGDKLRYIFLKDKIIMRGPFKVVIKAYNKTKIVTSQNDILYLQE